MVYQYETCQLPCSLHVLQYLVAVLIAVSIFLGIIFKPPPPVGAGGGYMFSGRPSVPPSVRACVRPCVRDSRGNFDVSAISPVSVDGFSPNFCHWCILGHI